MEFIDVFLFTLHIMLGLFSPGRRWVRCQLKHIFNSQFCQKKFCQKLLKSAILSFSYDR